MPPIAIVIALLITSVLAPGSALAQAPAPAYVAVGDSIEFGLGDDIGGDSAGIGYVPLVAAFLSSFFKQAVDLHNFGEPSAQTRDIVSSMSRT